MRPLVIELYAGSFGWGAGFVAEGWRSIGFDILHEPYHGPVPEHCELVLEDVLNIHGSRFKDAQAIVGSSPCQEFSYRAMPWKRAKALGPPLKGIELFEAQFRIQREASEAAGRYIPMVVENVKGAQPWVGRAKAHFGSYFLWGDVESVGGAIVCGGVRFGNVLRAKRSRKSKNGSWDLNRENYNPDHRWDDGTKLPGNNSPQRWEDREIQRLGDATKNNGGSWFNQAHNTESGLGQNPVNGVKVPGIDFSGYGKPGYKAQGFNVTAAQRYREEQGIKQEGSGPELFDKGIAKHSSRSDSRKAASAQIAKIPFALASHIARTFYPIEEGSTLRK